MNVLKAEAVAHGGLGYEDGGGVLWTMEVGDEALDLLDGDEGATLVVPMSRWLTKMRTGRCGETRSISRLTYSKVQALVRSIIMITPTENTQKA